MLPDSELLDAKILIVDDQAAHVQLLARVLEDVGYRQVSSTQDPQQVCTLHRRNAYDLILLDLQMPVLDGFGVLDGLKAGVVDLSDGVDHYLPVIALTAQPGHKLRALQAGARDFINKPFDVVEVQLRIRHWLEFRLLHKRLQAHNQALDQAVQQRTAELQQSEARYRRLIELAADWHWEQDEVGKFTFVSGPVLELLGVLDPAALADKVAPHDESRDGSTKGDTWDASERQTLQDHVAQRRPFLDLVLNRVSADGALQQFRISGEPMFDLSCRYTGYRGIGVQVVNGL